MRLTRLSVKRFGFIRDEKLEEIGPGIVVIGGRNRAGKSTFLQILRHLGYGFQGVPFKDKAEFEVDADICLPTKERLNISVKGLAEPKIKALTATEKDYSMSEVYKGLDHFTYKRLFTVSLEELQKIPPELENSQIARLQSVLLGAGISEMISLPQLENEFLKEADKIGGKNGKASVKSFKPYYTTITDAMKSKESALQEVEDYYCKKEEYEATSDRIQNLKNSSIPEKKLELIKIETLDNLYATFEEKIRLDNEIAKNHAEQKVPPVEADYISLPRVEELKSDYKKASDDYYVNMADFRQKINTGEKSESAKQAILKYKEKINGFYNELSGLKEITAAFISNKQKQGQEIDEIKDEMNSVNQSWKGDFEFIEALNTDEIEKDKLSQTIADYQNADDELKELQKNLEGMNDEREKLQQQLEDLKSEDPTAGLRNYFPLSVGTALLGALLAWLINPWLGSFVIVGIGGAVIYFINKSIAAGRWQERQFNLNQQAATIETGIEQTGQKIKTAEENTNRLQKNLEYYSEHLGLEKEISPVMLKEYFRDIQLLKARIAKVKRDDKALKEQEEKIKGKFTEITDVIQDLPAGNFFTAQVMSLEEIMADKEKWFAEVERLKDCLDSAETLELSQKIMAGKERGIRELCRRYGIENVDSIEDLLEQLKQEIADYIQFSELKQQQANCSDRILFELEKAPVIKAFAFADSDAPVKAAVLREFYRQFSSHREVRSALELVKKELTELETDLEDAQKTNQSLRNELARLASTEKIEKAQQEIREARKELRPLAEEYAVNRTAAFILSKARERMLEKMKNQSLNQAGEIFKKLTQGEYSEILPTDELEKADFKAVLSEDITQDTVDILSRGTREQLFLAVRVSRIAEIDALPVVIDDSLVNYDVKHLQQAMQIMAELAATHQIFILTCHPDMVRCIAKQTDNAQYWLLNKGRFSLSDGEDLAAYLA